MDLLDQLDSVILLIFNFKWLHILNQVKLFSSCKNIILISTAF